MKRVWFVASLLALAVMGISSALAQPPLDHFRCYYIPNQVAFNAGISLQDQFDGIGSTNFENIQQLTLARICNTTEKIFNGVTTPMTNPNHHLAMYLLSPQAITPRTVLASNQFDQPAGAGQALVVSEALFLLVNSGKIPLPGTTPSPSSDLDHYKCYQAGGARINAFPLLTDEFITENTLVLWPVLFCNPTIKIHGSTTTNIQNNRDHLVCYATVGTAFKGILNPPGVGIRNQFGLVAVQVLQPDMLCVPSAKLSWAVVPPPPPPTSSVTAPPKPSGGN